MSTIAVNLVALLLAIVLAAFFAKPLATTINNARLRRDKEECWERLYLYSFLFLTAITFLAFYAGRIGIR